MVAPTGSRATSGAIVSPNRIGSENTWAVVGTEPPQSERYRLSSCGVTCRR